MVRYNVESGPAMRSNCQDRGKREWGLNGTTSLRVALLVADDTELTRTVALVPTFDPREPGVQIFKNVLCRPVKHNHDGCTRKSGLRLQEMRHKGGVRETMMGRCSRVLERGFLYARVN
jgi:hypothetical protein